MSFSFPSFSSSSNPDDGYFSNSSSSSGPSSGPSSSYFSKLTSSFGSSDVSGSKDFLESNTLIAKTAFLLLVIILFFVLLRICISLLSWLLAPSQNMTLVNGMADATLPITISQDPSSQASMPIIRSVNQSDGIEFTWSIWIFIKPVATSSTGMSHIFSKGLYNSGSIGACYNKSTSSNNAPGLYLSGANTLEVLMDTTTTPACNTDTNAPITIDNMPINKWFNVVIRLTNNIMDVYINGRLTQRKTFTDGVPNQNYDDVYVCQNGGFNGYIADLKYYNSAVGTSEINSIVSSGPNTSINTSNLKNNVPPYLSGNWYDNNIRFEVEEK
jgi:Concanavalin A-like lectin/glucanases superfamily